MNRKWTVVQALSALILLGVVVGCAKNPPPAPMTDMPSNETPTATEVTPPDDPTPVADPTPDPWAGDLQDANTRAYEDGLLGEVYFDFDKATLREEARARLAKNARFLREHSQFMVTIEGHCDSRGTNEYNIALGERRAHATQAYLVSLGLSPSRFKMVSFGEENPVCREDTEGCWRRNRRAYFKITGRM